MSTEAEGAAAFAALCSSRALASACDPATVEPKDAMRLFLPPVPQDKLQLQRPLPEPYASWCRGFASAQAMARSAQEPNP